MRQRCLKSCTNRSLFVYSSAILLFTLCNLIAMILIQKHMRNGENLSVIPISETNTDDPYVDVKGTSVLIGDLLQNYPFNFNQSNHRKDSSRIYFIHDYVVTGSAWTGESSLGTVTLATQCSVDRLHMLFEVANSWRAPMSVAVYVPGPDFYIAKVYIAYMRLCSNFIRTNATFHFLYHRDMAPKLAMSYPKHVVPSCANSADALPLLMRYRTSNFRRWWLQALHPQNHLRNVARDGCLTPYHYLTDIDIVPVPDLATELQTFLNKAPQRFCKKCIYIVPTYEIPEKFGVPRKKSIVLEMIQKKQCRPFHVKVFIHNQYATNHSLWESLSATGPLTAAYKVSNYEFFYEPFYVARSNVLPHDQRFIGYGFTRNTQVFELYLAGYEFWVLNPAFAVHKGIQNKRGRGAWRERQNVINRKHFIVFKKEMDIRYRNVVKKL